MTYLSPLQFIHQRETYNLLDLAGDLGGILEIVTTILGVFALPVSEFSYYLVAIKHLFRARAKEGNQLFEKV